MSKWGTTIDWVALGEAVAFTLALGIVAFVLATLGGALWATRSRRNMRERYEQSRKAKGYRHVEPTEPWGKQ